MKERPILFSGAMVRALLAGTKTQTRRAMSIQPGDDTRVTCEHFNQTVIDRHGDEQPGPEIFGAWWHDGESGLRCPYGGPGDRLWVRESWAYNPDFAGIASRACFMADPEHKYDGLKWKPSIHMPRAVCRTLLDIKGVRAERLQDISEADALAEGIAKIHEGYGLPNGSHFHCVDPRQSYFSLWELINGPGSVEANPWLWVVEFKVAAPAAVKPSLDLMAA